MSTRSKSPLPLVITAGDSSGIGFEVTAKALIHLAKKKQLHRPIVIFRKEQRLLSPRERSVFLRYEKLLDITFNRKSVAEEEFLKNPSDFFPLSKTTLTEVFFNKDAPAWVEIAGKLCVEKVFAGMVTAPLSKTLIASSGYKEIGHTEILKKVSGAQKVYMTFLGEDFHVVLLTGHIPLSRVAGEVSAKSLQDLVETLRTHFPLSLKKKIALLGMNPHAGDRGLIGDEELGWMNTFVQKNSDILTGPLPPDAAFLPSNWKKYSLYLCLYHDQGLIPFKCHHGQDGVHYSMGLPFIRTSVDHGTAFDLFGKDKANPLSMIRALEWAIFLAKKNS